MVSVAAQRSSNTTPSSPSAEILTEEDDDEEKDDIQEKVISAGRSTARWRRARPDSLSQKTAPSSIQPSPVGDQKDTQSAQPARYCTLRQVGLPTLIVVVLLICGRMLVPPLGWSQADKRCNTNWQQSIQELKRAYPGQNSRFWYAIQSAMQTIVCVDLVAAATPPLVILLLPAASEEQTDPTKFENFIQDLGQHLARVNSAGSRNCVTLNFSDLNSRLISPYDAKGQTNVKKLLLEKLKSEYDRDSRCFHIPNLDLLAGDVVLGLHGVSDFYSSPFRSSIFIFSLAEPPPCEWPHDSRKMETCVRKHFHALWDQSLGEEEVAALISRFTGRIAVFV